MRFAALPAALEPSDNRSLTIALGIEAARKSVAAPPEKRAMLNYFLHRGLADIFMEAGEPALAIPQYERAIAVSTIEGYTKDSRAKLAEARNAAGK